MTYDAFDIGWRLVAIAALVGFILWLNKEKS
jgi:hypothetical protein